MRAVYSSGWTVTWLIGGATLPNGDPSYGVKSVRYCPVAGEIFVGGNTKSGLNYTPKLWKVNTAGTGLDLLWTGGTANNNHRTAVWGVIEHGGDLFMAEHIHGASTKIYRSKDGGTTWSAVHTCTSGGTEQWKNTVRQQVTTSDRVAWVGSYLLHCVAPTITTPVFTEVTAGMSDSHFAATAADGNLAVPYAINGTSPYPIQYVNAGWTGWTSTAVSSDCDGAYSSHGTYLSGIGWLMGAQVGTEGAFYMVAVSGGSGYVQMIHDWGASGDATAMAVEETLTGSGTVRYSLRASDTLAAITGSVIPWHVIELDGSGDAAFILRGRYIQMRAEADECFVGSLIDSVEISATLHP
jgi:hypothetical protein